MTAFMRGQRASALQQRASHAESAASRGEGSISAGRRKRVASAAVARPTTVNTASCCRPSTPETRNVAYAMHVEATPVPSVGHSARALAQGDTPARWWLNRWIG